ncbi:Mammalian cell entry related domain protein [Gloeothece citriformis PCC 7424]|uniref:Mammalian cell entry related domain protein n=1 Tax=Gloeothece citriformis (strain PCC 7424) TaxID=65393 RepID=B7KB83_GLOC7|nr:MlaD family protein [Gloeothece citriformis]ACK71439.1 Mammalian cell entry related domain protein [Gloeothece citriformis PCC 7424]
MLRSRSIREGAVGLFALLGLVIFGGITIWLRGGNWGQQSYQIIVEFDNVAGLQLGAPVQYRGVQVGRLAALKPRENKVEALLEISSTDLVIPRDVTIQTSRYGLIGEPAIDITPKTLLSPQAKSLSPLGEECKPDLILCDNTRIQGDSGGQLVETLTRLAQTYSNPEFFNNLNNAAKNASLTLKDVSKLSKDFSTLSKSAQREIALVSRNFEQTTTAATQTANDASLFINNANAVVLENRRDINEAIQQTTLLMNNASQLIAENRQRISGAIESIDQMSDRLTLLATNLNQTALKINSTMDAADTEKMVQNLEVVLTNAAAVSQELREVSETLNDPTIILTLQQTLDSARVTFENTQKITSDVDELVGDPEFRSNLRRLVNGLSNLVSSSQALEQQMIAVQKLDEQAKIIAQQIEPLTQDIYCAVEENKNNLASDQSSREMLAYMCNKARQTPPSTLAPVRPLLTPKKPISSRPEEQLN